MKKTHQVRRESECDVLSIYALCAITDVREYCIYIPKRYYGVHQTRHEWTRHTCPMTPHVSGPLVCDLRVPIVMPLAYSKVGIGQCIQWCGRTNRRAREDKGLSVFRPELLLKTSLFLRTKFSKLSTIYHDEGSTNLLRTISQRGCNFLQIRSKFSWFPHF